MRKLLIFEVGGMFLDTLESFKEDLEKLEEQVKINFIFLSSNNPGLRFVESIEVEEVEEKDSEVGPTARARRRLSSSSFLGSTSRLQTELNSIFPDDKIIVSPVFLEHDTLAPKTKIFFNNLLVGIFDASEVFKSVQAGDFDRWVNLIIARDFVPSNAEEEEKCVVRLRKMLQAVFPQHLVLISLLDNDPFQRSYGTLLKISVQNSHCYAEHVVLLEDFDDNESELFRLFGEVFDSLTKQLNNGE